MSAPSVESKGAGAWPAWLTSGVLVLAVALAYANTFGVPFLLDDRSAIVENASITDLSNLARVLAPAGTTTAGRPLLNLSFALNHAVGGQAVAGYHAVNLAIHLLAALVLAGIVRRTFESAPLAASYGAVARPLGFFAALLWALHPLLTGAVTYLSQRAESLMGLWYLLTLYAFIRATTSARPAGWLVASVAAGACGMLTKEVMMTAPVIVLLYDRVFVSNSFGAAVQRRPAYYVGLALCWVLLAAVMVSSGLGERDVGLRAGVDWLHYALTESRVVVSYARLALVPYPLVFDYGREILVREFWPVAPYLALVAAALVGTAWLFWRGRTALGWAAAAWFILLAPTSSFVPVVGQPMAESRMYLPLAVMAVMAVLAVHRWAGRACWLVLAALALLLGGATLLRNHDYRSALVILEDSVRHVPGNSRGQYNLANELRHTPGRAAEAVAHYEAALQSDPDLAEAHVNLATLLAEQGGSPEKALAHFAAALALKPDLAEAHANAARLLATLPGRMPEVVAHLEAVVRLQPDSAEAHFELANKLARLPDWLPEALAQYEAAIRLRPDFLEARYNYANRLANLPDRLPEAVAQYEAVLRLNPSLPEAHRNLGRALANLGRLEDARRELETALQLRPGDGETRAMLEQVRAALGR